MIVTFVSQCEKKVLKRTRRILDSFANRIGSNVWQTAITEDGLATVKQLLRKSATKSTAVSCHRIKTRRQSELVWIVGNKRKFNEVGIVPVNTTRRNLLHAEWENGWQITQLMAVVAGIAGLFHDLGKANDLFQEKLKPQTSSLRFEPYRHEWVSLRLFEAFVKMHDNKSDTSWLEQLEHLHTQNINQHLLNQLTIDTPTDVKFVNPITNLPPLATLIAWLIVSHHRLPQYNNNPEHAPSFSFVNEWLNRCFDNSWNSLNHNNSKVEPKHIQKNWQFSLGLPFDSQTWIRKAHELSRRALVQLNTNPSKDYLSHPFLSHISRLCLMLADHHYSAQEPKIQWQDQSYKAFANTYKATRLYKQRLDEHNVGVAHHAYFIAKQLFNFSQNSNGELPALDDDKRILRNGLLTRQSSDANKRDFKWQDDAFLIAKRYQTQANKHGFFGICMASTGKGKTLANARIMYALADRNKGCRFSIALGLRSLTLQTGRALQALLKIDDMDVATVIGSQAILNLENQIPLDNFEEEVRSACAKIGSESLDIGEEDYEIEYDDIDINEGFTSTYLADNSKAQKLLHAPILVSTIDHLTPATEGARGGRQIVPMLRLLTADLVLDEPDEFGPDDLPALSRLVNWAGMLGAKVLLSTASMPPDFAYALFDAYQSGRQAYHKDTSIDPMPAVICGWFDEYKQHIAEIADFKSYRQSHNEYVKTRCQNLIKNAQPLRKAKLISTDIKDDDTDLYQSLAQLIQHNCIELHHHHHQIHPANQQAVSIGLVRFANINPLVAIAKRLFAIPVPADTQLHYCVYHSQYPLLQRAEIEKTLDCTLDRHDPSSLWQNSSIVSALNGSNAQHHIFVVLATSVAEVGRDHDYDWAIAEPSSMRSLVQLAGRIQRHRKQVPDTHNYYILEQNIRSLKGRAICYTRPGFETKNNRLVSKNIQTLLRKDEYTQVNAIPCIQYPSQLSPQDKLVDMEHLAYRHILFGGHENYKLNAKNWWRYNMHWNSEMQRRTPFRKSMADIGYCLNVSEEYPNGIWQRINEQSSPHEYYDTDDIQTINISIYQGNNAWGSTNVSEAYFQLAEKLNKPLPYISRVYGQVRLMKSKKVANWLYSPLLGIHQAL
ncbi:type I-F CRISPR-associated helicase Cas3f [Psychrobacter pygoscelis]|uniref:type I-F CRISPR-associated helicase Cas3f n=1 Tax=Psychrobacter pygoscelis TaxID=2488563 RepID=UPI00103F4E64|nr:type I-F CRISPR-associated helicase Cas3f [Psychrobacter pygoscelis]